MIKFWLAGYVADLMITAGFLGLFVLCVIIAVVCDTISKRRRKRK